MATPIGVTPELAETLDKFADRGFSEAVPNELPGIGGFEYVVLPSGLMKPSHGFGGYDALNETGDTESLIMVSDAIPKHVRGLLVGHILMHKTVGDNGGPHLCQDHDKSIQAVLAEAEPDLIEPFYNETETMYQQGLRAHLMNPTIPRLVIDRYSLGLDHSHRKGELSHSATQQRARLEDLGLLLPDGSVALTGMDKTTGHRTFVSMGQERGNRHVCRNCSHDITKGSFRITTSTLERVNGYDHHHYHPGCFSHIELGIFTNVQQVDQEEARG